MGSKGEGELSLAIIISITFWIINSYMALTKDVIGQQIKYLKLNEINFYRNKELPLKLTIKLEGPR